MPEFKSMGEKLSLNFELLLRIETNLKLNLIGTDGKSLLTEDDKDEEEVHFLRVESVTGEYEIRLSTVF